MAENNKVTVKKDVGSQVLDRVNQLCEAGFRLPADYSAANAIKASMLVLQETVDKNKRPVLEVCTPVSIQKALFKMVVCGMDVSLNQGYFICRGDKLTFQPSYFGHILQVKRLYPNWTPIAHTIREGDDFVYTIDPETGKMKLVKHEQKFENLDKEFEGAYVYLPCDDGSQELYVMTRKQIMKAWSKSSSQTLQVHKDFDEKMAIRTVINSGCTKVINATPRAIVAPDEDDDMQNIHQPNDEGQFAEFEEVKDEQQQLPEGKPTDDGSAEREKAMASGTGSEPMAAQEAPRPNDDEF